MIAYIQSGRRDGARYADGQASIGYALPITAWPENGVTRLIWIRSGMQAPAPTLSIAVELALAAKRAKLAEVSGHDRRIVLLTRDSLVPIASHTEDEIATCVQQDVTMRGGFDAVFLVDLLEIFDTQDAVIKPYGDVRLLVGVIPEASPR